MNLLRVMNKIEIDLYQRLNNLEKNAKHGDGLLQEYLDARIDRLEQKLESIEYLVNNLSNNNK